MKVKSLVCLVAILLLVTACGNGGSSNSLAGIYDDAKKISDIYRNEIQELDEFYGKGCTPVVGNMGHKEIPKSDGSKFVYQNAYDICVASLKNLKDSVNDFNKKMDKSSNKDLKDAWLEVKPKYDTAITQLEEIFKIYYSMTYEDKNLSKFDSASLKEMKEYKHLGYTCVACGISEKMNLDWYKNEYGRPTSLVSAVKTYIGFDSFLNKVENACIEDETVTCSFELEDED